MLISKIVEFVPIIVFKIIPISIIATVILAKLRRDDSLKKSIVFTPLIILMAVVPLIVFLKEMPMPPDSLAYKAWPSGNVNIDFFSYYKSLWIMGSAIAAWILFLIFNNLKSGKYNLFHIPIFIYMFLALISTMLSPYREIAFTGVADRYESVIVIFAYLIVTIILMNMVEDEKDVKTLINALIISSVAAGTIGIFQYFGLDFFQSNIGQSLMLPASKEDLVGRLAFRFGICNIYSTMYNTNYVGSYMVMLLMITFTMYINAGKNIVKNIKASEDFLGYFEKKYSERIIYGLLTLLVFANLVGSRSRAGMVGGVVAFAVLLIIMRKSVLKNIKYIILIILLAFGVFHTMNSFGHGVLFRKVSTIAKDAKNISGKKAVYSNIKDITVNGNELTIEKENKAESIKLKYNLKNDEIKIYSLDGKEINKVKVVEIYKSDTEEFSHYDFRLYTDGRFNVQTENDLITTNIIPKTGFEYVGEEIQFETIKNLNVSGNEILIEKNEPEKSVKVLYKTDTSSLKMLSVANEEIEIEKKRTDYTISKEGYEKYFIKDSGNGIFEIVTEIGPIRVIATDKGIKYLSKNGTAEKFVSIKDVDRLKKFDGKEKVGTGRVFIWSRTVPLLKERILYGSGPDTFSLVFPQDDYIGKLKTFQNPEIIVDKPHNMYLQIAVNTGVMSLVAFLVLIAAYLITGIKAYLNSNYETYMEKMGGGIFLAIIGYCVAGLFNDSLVSVAPVFWGLLGIGIAVNLINLKYDIKNKVNLNKKKRI